MKGGGATGRGAVADAAMDVDSNGGFGGKGGASQCKGKGKQIAGHKGTEGVKSESGGRPPMPSSMGEASAGGGAGGATEKAFEVEEKRTMHGEEFDNFMKFLTLTMQAVRRSVLKAAELQPMRLQDLPNIFERQWGTVFEKSRLGLQDLSDLAALLSLFPDCFHVDSSNQTGPTVVCQPGQTRISPLSEDRTMMLWKRSKDLQPKKLFDCLETFKENLDKNRNIVAELEKAKQEARDSRRVRVYARRALAPAPGPTGRTMVEERCQALREALGTWLVPTHSNDPLDRSEDCEASDASYCEWVYGCSNTEPYTSPEHEWVCGCMVAPTNNEDGDEIDHACEIVSFALKGVDFGNDL